MRTTIKAFIYTLVALSTLAVLGRSAEEPARHLWTPADSVALKMYMPYNTGIFSPDGKWVYVREYKTSLSTDSCIFDLLVFDVNDLRNLLNHNSSQVAEPIWKVTRTESCAVNRLPGFTPPVWDSDSSGIRFDGLDDALRTQLFRLDCGSGRVEQLTSFSKDCGAGIKVFGDAKISGNTYTQLAKQSSGSAYPWHRLELSDLDGVYGVRRWQIIAFRGGSEHEISPPVANIADAPGADGKLLVGIQTISPFEVPKSWKAYESQLFNYGNILWPEGVPTFVRINAEKGEYRFLFDAPTGLATAVGRSAQLAIKPRVLWTSAGDQCILVNTALPLRGPDDTERRHMSYVVGFDPVAERWSVIEPLQATLPNGVVRKISSVTWLKEGEELLIAHSIGGTATTATVYRFVDGNWVGSDTDDRKLTTPSNLDPKKFKFGETTFTTLIKEDLNTPPTVIFTDGTREVALTKPEPVFERATFTHQQVFEWEGKDGKKYQGGLLLPPNLDRKVPLVVQIYTFDSKIFAPDGPGVGSPAYAGQTLVTLGIAVLNVSFPSGEVSATPAGLTGCTAIVDSAVEALAAKNIIDKEKVGVVGFSRGGFCSLYLITHPEGFVPAAAVLDDNYPGNFGYDLLVTALNGHQEIMYGGNFWNNKESWLRLEPMFNMDRLKTPVLQTEHDSPYAASLDRVGAYIQLRRPLEYVVFPRGAHGLSRPRERYASQVLTVDWMSFWLKGVLPADADQAERWQGLKADWERQKAWEAAGHPVGSLPARDFMVPEKEPTKATAKSAPATK